MQEKCSQHWNPQISQSAHNNGEIPVTGLTDQSIWLFWWMNDCDLISCYFPYFIIHTKLLVSSEWISCWYIPVIILGNAWQFLAWLILFQIQQNLWRLERTIFTTTQPLRKDPQPGDKWNEKWKPLVLLSISVKTRESLHSFLNMLPMLFKWPTIPATDWRSGYSV